MVLIVPNLTMYMHPYSKLIKANINESSAVDLVSGSPEAPGIWNRVKMALPLISNQPRAEPKGSSRKQQSGNNIESLPLP